MRSADMKEEDNDDYDPPRTRGSGQGHAYAMRGEYLEEGDNYTDLRRRCAIT